MYISSILLTILVACGWNRKLRIFAEEANPRTNCKAISACESCPKDIKSNPDPFPSALVTACKETGKRIQWSCSSEDSALETGSIDDPAQNQEANLSYQNDHRYTSCQRTKIEDEYQVLHFQILCLVVSFFSWRSVNREKIVSESLFDKLKRQQQQGKQKQQEMIPLV